MKLKNAIDILEYHQEWRVGKREDMFYEPKQLTEALDIILKEAKNHSKINDEDRYFSLEYFKDKHNAEVIIYPIFSKNKCGYDSFEKLGYQYNILTPNKDSNNCYHIDLKTIEIFPTNLLDMDDEECNTFEKINYIIYKSKKEAEDKALEELKLYYK